MLLRDFKKHDYALNLARELYLTRYPATDPQMLHAVIDYRVYPAAVSIMEAQDSWKAIMTDSPAGYVQGIFPLRNRDQRFVFARKIADVSFSLSLVC